MKKLNKCSVLCITSAKDGAGRTTTVVNLAEALSTLDKKILVIDCDFKGNTTSQLGIGKQELCEKNLALGILNELNGEELIIRSPTLANVDVIGGTCQLTEVIEKFTDKKSKNNSNIPANINFEEKDSDLADFVQKTSAQVRQHLLLKSIISETILKKYDIIIVDTSSTFDCLYISAIASAHYYLIPVIPQQDNMVTIPLIIHSIEKIRKYLNPNLYNLGVLFCKYDKNLLLHSKYIEIIKTLAKTANLPVCTSMIPKDEKSLSIENQIDTSSKQRNSISKSYWALAGELLPKFKGKRLGKVPHPKMESVSCLFRECDNF